MKKVAVIGAAGHVGFPFSLVLADAEHKVIGIDRIDSSNGYILSNIVPCCEKCNIAKGEMSIDEFREHITKISNTFIKNMKSNTIYINKTKSLKVSFIRPTKIVEMYIRDKLSDYIELCVKDNRSPIFIQKLTELLNKKPKLSSEEFKKYIKTILLSETRSTVLTEVNSRKRIPRKEIIGYLNLNNIDAIINIYEKTFGHDDELKDDFIYLGNQWSTFNDDEKPVALEKVFIKYQNKRAKNKLFNEIIQLAP